MNFGEKLQKWMEENNVTVKELAEKCDVTRQSVKKWINGGNMFNKYRIKIKDITGIDDCPETPVVDEPVYVPFVMREIVAVKQEGCVGCLFDSLSVSDEESACTFIANKITGLMCSKDNVIFKFKEQWKPCPITVKEGETVRHITSKLMFTVISPPLNNGTRFKNKMVIKGPDDELMVDYTNFEVEA